jgi:hypothetical protein
MMTKNVLGSPKESGGVKGEITAEVSKWTSTGQFRGSFTTMRLSGSSSAESPRSAESISSALSLPGGSRLDAPSLSHDKATAYVALIDLLHVYPSPVTS